MAKPKRTKRKEKKNIPHGHAHIKSTFNNTIVTITDPQARPHRFWAACHQGERHEGASERSQDV